MSNAQIDYTQPLDFSNPEPIIEKWVSRVATARGLSLDAAILAAILAFMSPGLVVFFDFDEVEFVERSISEIEYATLVGVGQWAVIG